MLKSGKCMWRPKVYNTNHQGSKTDLVPKKVEMVVLQVPTRQSYKKGMWIIDSGDSRHMIYKKENSKSVKTN